MLVDEARVVEGFGSAEVEEESESDAEAVGWGGGCAGVLVVGVWVDEEVGGGFRLKDWGGVGWGCTSCV